MKTFLSILVLIVSITAQASPAESKAEAIQLANVILDHPSVAAEIQKEWLSIVDYSVESDKGVNQFTIKLGRVCFCMPKSGTLTIIQDLRPTYADGAIEYTTELKID